MGDDNRFKRFHTQRCALNMGFVQKITGDNHSGGDTFFF